MARAAERADRPDALQQAVVGLQTVAPDRVPGAYALVLAQKEGAEAGELVGLLPRAIAAAPDQATVDSLLALHARLLQQTSGCGQAMFQYRAVLRRTQDSALDPAGPDKAPADCALSLGQRSVTSGRDEDAALWFAEAARMDSSSATGRRALFAYGETRLLQGDTLAAALAFQAIASEPAVSDSFSGKARARLAAHGTHPHGGPDTGPDSHEPHLFVRCSPLGLSPSRAAEADAPPKPAAPPPTIAARRRAPTPSRWILSSGWPRAGCGAASGAMPSSDLERVLLEFSPGDSRIPQARY